MAALNDPNAVDSIVDAVVGQAGERLTTAAADAQDRHDTLTKARKVSGNRMRTDEIKASIEAEDELITDARALASRATQLKQQMADDLRRLVSLALGDEGS